MDRERAVLFVMVALVMVLVFSPTLVFCVGRVDLYLFYVDWCPHCKAEKMFLSGIAPEHPGLVVHYCNIEANETCRRLLDEFSNRLGERPVGVPVTVVGDRMIVGFESPSTTGTEIRRAIRECLEKGCDTIVPTSNSDAGGHTVLLLALFCIAVMVFVLFLVCYKYMHGGGERDEREGIGREAWRVRGLAEEQDY